MSVIEPINHEVLKAGKRKKYAASIRFWHWVNVVIISGSLFTVLINATLFSHAQHLFVKDVLIHAGTSVNDKQVTAVTHGLEDQVWSLHIYFGYALAALFFFRIIAEFFLPPSERLIYKLKIAYLSCFIIRQERESAKHELVVKGLYFIFYLLLMIMVLTGLLLAFENYTGIPRNINHSIKEFHGFCMYLILGFVLVHLLGVFVAERKDGSGIVSGMINGGD